MGDRRLSELYTPVPMIEPKDYGSVGTDTDSIHMGLVNGVEMVFTFGAITGNSILIPYAGATAGTKTTALAFQYRFGQGDFKAASADILGDLVSVAATGLTLTAATFDHRQITIELDAIAMPDGQPWLTFNIDATASVMLAAAIANPRRIHSGHTPPTII